LCIDLVEGRIGIASGVAPGDLPGSIFFTLLTGYKADPTKKEKKKYSSHMASRISRYLIVI
jgi:hypothetical protein